jgi:putative nucleotidyltransferase with HDIG domain
VTPSEADAARVRELLPELARIESPQWRDIVVGLWVHAWRRSAWDDPADVYFTIGRLPDARDPYKERWNQVEHTRAVIALIDAMLPVFERHVGARYDHDVLYASALLHDVAKLVEFGPGSDGPAKTPAAVVHHAAVGAQWALEAGLPPAVAHAIVAHSPSTSASPETPEALAVKLADQTVTDVNRMTTFIEERTTP